MTNLRKLINLISEASSNIKDEVIDLVNTIDDDSLLKKVLNTLKAGNIDERIVSIIGKDPDASKFVKQIANVIVAMDFPVEDKDAFLQKYSSGIVDIAKLLDGNPHSFAELVGNDRFSTELFKILTINLTSQGVGPGEVALATFHPDIAWSGRTAGGGDILVNGRAIEVKTSVAAGGRWINARKAKMNLPQIVDALSKATGITAWPDRINASKWTNEILPIILEKNPTQLNATCSAIATGLFTSTSTTAYIDALKSGNLTTLIDEHLRTGYNNYKAVSNFEGILLMDVRTEITQYFKDYDSMQGRIKSDAVYIYAPESEIMPKVTLLPDASSRNTKVGSTKTPASKSAADAVEKRSLRDPGKSLGLDDIRPTTPSKSTSIDRQKR
jgi:hypothetical protein